MNKDMKQTAVEWLVEQLSNYDLKMIELFKKEINQAKEMEKQQIIDAFDLGDANAIHRVVQQRENYIQYAEQYYNETFKQDEK